MLFLVSDQGEIWGKPITMPSLQGQIDQAWLEVKFVLKWPRNHYRPHDPYIYFNSAQPDLVLAFDRLSNLPERLLLGRPIVL